MIKQVRNIRDNFYSVQVSGNNARSIASKYGVANPQGGGWFIFTSREAFDSFVKEVA